MWLISVLARSAIAAGSRNGGTPEEADMSKLYPNANAPLSVALVLASRARQVALTALFTPSSSPGTKLHGVQ